MDEATGLLSITPAQFANLQSLFFNIGGVRTRPTPNNYRARTDKHLQTAFELTPNAQIFPRAVSLFLRRPS